MKRFSPDPSPSSQKNRRPPLWRVPNAPASPFAQSPIGDRMEQPKMMSNTVIFSWDLMKCLKYWGCLQCLLTRNLAISYIYTHVCVSHAYEYVWYLSPNMHRRILHNVNRHIGGFLKTNTMFWRPCTWITKIDHLTNSSFFACEVRWWTSTSCFFFSS